MDGFDLLARHTCPYCSVTQPMDTVHENKQQLAIIIYAVKVRWPLGQLENDVVTGANIAMEYLGTQQEITDEQHHESVYQPK